MTPLDTTPIASISDPSPLLVVELKNSHAACKEAVVDGLLNILTARLSGKGEFGKELYRGKPRSALTTAFLLPMPKSEREGDEEASPIQISAHGLDFQVKSTASDAEIVVRVKGCAYVRIFPNEKEVAYDGPCQPVFPIKPEIKKELNLRIRVLLNELRAKLGKGYFKTKEWADQSAAIRKQVHEGMGLPFQDMEDATPALSEPSSEGSIGVFAMALESCHPACAIGTSFSTRYGLRSSSLSYQK